MNSLLRMVDPGEAKERANSYSPFNHFSAIPVGVETDQSGLHGKDYADPAWKINDRGGQRRQALRAACAA